MSKSETPHSSPPKPGHPAIQGKAKEKSCKKCLGEKYSNAFRPYHILIRKEEEKEDKFCKMCVEIKHKAIPDPHNPFTKKTIFTQTYPTCLVPAALPRKACCFYCVDK